MTDDVKNELSRDWSDSDYLLKTLYVANQSRICVISQIQRNFLTRLWRFSRSSGCGSPNPWNNLLQRISETHTQTD